MATPQKELEERASEVERLADELTEETISAELKSAVADLQQAVAHLTAYVRSEFEELFEAELADIEVALVADARDRDARGKTHDAREVLAELGAEVPND